MEKEIERSIEEKIQRMKAYLDGDVIPGRGSGIFVLDRFISEE